MNDVTTLRDRIEEAVRDYRTVWPEPNSLSANLALAVEALPFLPTSRGPEDTSAVTPDDITSAVMAMLNTLHMLNALVGPPPPGYEPVRVPFADLVSEAVAAFDRPEIRHEMVRLLYSEVDR